MFYYVSQFHKLLRRKLQGFGRNMSYMFDTSRQREIDLITEEAENFGIGEEKITGEPKYNKCW